jgi:small subunit ribosomal protein S19e
MVTFNDVPINDVIEKSAEELKKVNTIQPPAWAAYAKTGCHKERPPANEDWWYMRCAAVLQSVRKLGPIGTNKLRVKYGGRKNRGHKPDRFVRGSGNVIRKVLQQLEASELIAKAEKGVHKGRVVAPKGVSLLDKAAKAVRDDLKQNAN